MRVESSLRYSRAMSWDRIRFGGPVSRDRLVAAVRARFPEVWAPAGPG